MSETKIKKCIHCGNVLGPTYMGVHKTHYGVKTFVGLVHPGCYEQFKTEWTENYNKQAESNMKVIGGAICIFVICILGYIWIHGGVS